MNQSDKIVLFQEKQIRRVWHNEQWYFAVVDVLAVLTESQNPSVLAGSEKRFLSVTFLGRC